MFQVQFGGRRLRNDGQEFARMRPISGRSLDTVRVGHGFKTTLTCVPNIIARIISKIAVSETNGNLCFYRVYTWYIFTMYAPIANLNIVPNMMYFVILRLQ